MMENIIEDAISKDIIKASTNNKIKSPANDTLFNINEEETLLTKEQSDKFHTMVAKMLYMGKRIKPQLMVVIAFLSTRVTC